MGGRRVDTFGPEDDYPIPRGIVELASMTFPSHRGAAQEYVMPLQGMRRAVAARLRSRVSGTVLRDDTEHVHSVWRHDGDTATM